ncbi:hypothetical protein V1508DRAFT_188649 [Lipomyces doorenjongii]|uniref:uncharacterized protein n=1 Tax=Lipomyces doorenjongii TaxID=383834 RepID=UPI0034CE3480
MTGVQGHVIETITLCVFAPTVGEYVNRTSDSTIVVQAPIAIQRMTIDAQASICTSFTDEHKNDNEDQILPVQVLTMVENEKKKRPSKFTPKRWFRKHVRMATNAAQSAKVDSPTQKNRRNFLSLLIHGKKKIPDTESIAAIDTLEGGVETGGLSIPTATKEFDAHAKDEDDYESAGDLNGMTSEVDDDDRSMISVRFLTACIAELEAEQEKRMPECGVVADDIPAMFLDHINGNIIDKNMKASIADADEVYEVGDMTLLVLFELPEVDSANRRYHASTTSTAPLAGTTGSFAVEEYCAPENQIDGVSDAEADMPSPIENPTEHETIRALADTSPEPNAGPTNELVSLLAKDTVDRDIKLPVCTGESMHDVTDTTFESDQEHVVDSEHCTSTHDEPPVVTYACVESTENDNEGCLDWIDADISFGDILSQPYEPVSSHESTTAITAEAEAEGTPADTDDLFVSDVSFTDILFNSAGSESENDSTQSEHSTDPSTTPMMRSGTSSPVSTTATTPIEASDDTIVGGEKELFADILFVNDEEWCLPVPGPRGCRSNVSVSSSVAAAEIESKTDITTPVTEYSHVAIPTEYRAPYIAPVQDLESQDPHHVTTSLFGSRTLSRVKSVLTSSFCSVPDTSETISDILVSFPPSIRRLLMSDLNTHDIFHGTCDHANPTGCANCSEKLDYLKRVRGGIAASSCNDEAESVRVARARDNVLRGMRA